MAKEKTSRTWPAIVHAVFYTAGFALLTFDWRALLLIGASHLLIDRFRLARHVCWAKNFLAPRSWWKPWAECSGTGYHKEQVPWLSVWLMIVADNTMHLVINAFALACWV
jgi:hypothetical protein